jgi:hypothetical protein
MGNLRNRMTDKMLDRIDRWVDDGPIETLGRANEEEFARKARTAKIKACVYGAGFAIAASTMQDKRGAANTVRTGVVLASGWSAWLNASKALLYGGGVQEEQTARVHEHLGVEGISDSPTPSTDAGQPEAFDQ